MGGVVGFFVGEGRGGSPLCRRIRNPDGTTSPYLEFLDASSTTSCTETSRGWQLSMCAVQQPIAISPVLNFLYLANPSPTPAPIMCYLFGALYMECICICIYIYIYISIYVYR